MLPNMFAVKPTGCSLEEKTDSFEAVKIADKKVALVGNVGVVKPLLMGTPEECAEAAIHSADAGFNIISAGCGMSAFHLPDAPLSGRGHLHGNGTWMRR